MEKKQSILVITSVENLQNSVISFLKSSVSIPGIYLSLNKTQASIEKILQGSGIDTKKLFFIDCVTSEKKKEDVLHIHPTQLELLTTAIKSFIQEIQGEKFLLIDALSTLLIYNNPNKVAQFVKEITEFASANYVTVIAFSPKTKGEELLEKIFNFFDEVRKK